MEYYLISKGVLWLGEEQEEEILVLYGQLENLERLEQRQKGVEWWKKQHLEPLFHPSSIELRWEFQKVGWPKQKPPEALGAAALEKSFS